MLTSKEVAAAATRALDSKKGVGIQLIRVGDVTTLADYFLICTGTSNTHVKTLCDCAEATLEGLGETMLGREGHRGNTWELLDYGCDEVIAIRLNGFGIIHPLRDKQKIRQIFPSEQLGPVMRFDPATSRRNIQMGYYDTMRFMRELPGQLYYFSEKADGFAAFAALPENAIKAASIPLRLPEGLSPRRALFEHILPAVAAELRLPREAGYDDLLLALLEHRAEQLGIGRFRWYTPAQLQAVIAESTALPEEPRRPLLRSRPLEAAEILAAALPLLG